ALSPADGEREKTERRREWSPYGDCFSDRGRGSLSPSDGGRVRGRGAFNEIRRTSLHRQRNILRHTDAVFSEQVRKLASLWSLFDPLIEQRTRDIIEAVRTRGDEAVLDQPERFGGANLLAGQLPVTTAELMNASLKADESLREAVATANKNIAAFSRKS